VGAEPDRRQHRPTALMRAAPARRSTATGLIRSTRCSCKAFHEEARV
jgi:hypothetical protein